MNSSLSKRVRIKTKLKIEYKNRGFANNLMKGETLPYK